MDYLSLEKMLKRLQFAWRYFIYLLRSKKSTSSKFVNELIEDVFHSDQQFYAFEEIEGIRTALKSNHQKIKITDFGAGSNINNSNERKISDLAKNSAKAPQLGQMMFRLINKFQPNNMLELGTSLGISACYQLAPKKNANFITMEGCPQTAAFAKKVISQINVEPKIVVGDFNQTLPTTLDNFQQIDYTFFDGNHQKEPTIQYFEQCLKKAHAGTIFIFDDIHWSKGMEEAWEYIIQHPKVYVSIDLFWVGIVFFDPSEPKSNFILR